MTRSKPELKVTVFSDYICPFCYVGDARLNRLRTDYDLKVNWCFLEIHPETSPAGEPVASLDYPSETWQRMMATLREMAEEENLSLLDHDFTTNSQSALLLAEAAKYVDRDVFYHLHNRLFEAYFSEGQNIGDRDCLRRLALDAGMNAEQIEAAWQDSAVAIRLQHYQKAAHDLGVKATPTYFIGEQRLDGAVPVEQLVQAANAVC
ncbi:MAG: DsbA family protein [Gammaproteobacteria bacterium]|nr:MAG: DsbA family protein [Gammaproteobacteria bacterium]